MDKYCPTPRGAVEKTGLFLGFNIRTGRGRLLPRGVGNEQLAKKAKQESPALNIRTPSRIITVRQLEAMRSRKTVMCGALGGLLFGLSTMLLLGFIERLPRDGVVSILFRSVHAPEGWLGVFLTDWWFPGQSDMGIVIWFFLHPQYWVAIGTVVASLFVIFKRRRNLFAR